MKHGGSVKCRDRACAGDVWTLIGTWNRRAPRFKPEELAALALLVSGSELWLPWLKGDERKAATAAVSDVRAMLEGEKP
jgi:hypothetical protein